MKIEDNQLQLGGIPYTTSIRPLCLRKAINAAVLESIQIPTRASICLEEITVYADKALKKKASCGKTETQSGGWWRRWLPCFVLRQEKGNLVCIARGRAREDLGVVQEGMGGHCSDEEEENRKMCMKEWEAFEKQWLKKREQKVNLNHFSLRRNQQNPALRSRERRLQGESHTWQKGSKDDDHHTSLGKARVG